MNLTARHFSPRASLAALGLRLRRLGLLEAITSTVKVPQKTVRHTPSEKLYDAFVAILAGADLARVASGRVVTDAEQKLVILFRPELGVDLPALW